MLKSRMWEIYKSGSVRAVIVMDSELVNIRRIKL
jgi:hypothetical protein